MAPIPIGGQVDEADRWTSTADGMDLLPRIANLLRRPFAEPVHLGAPACAVQRAHPALRAAGFACAAGSSRVVRRACLQRAAALARDGAELQEDRREYL